MKHLKAIVLAVVLCLCMSVTAFAADSGEPIVIGGTEYPVIYSTTSGDYNIMDWLSEHPSGTVYIHIDAASNYMFRSTTDMYIDGSGKLVAKANAEVDMFKLNDAGTKWTYYTSLNLEQGKGYLTYKKDIKAISRDIKDEAGSVVLTQHDRFYKALPVVVLEVTEEQMEKTLPEVFGAMGSLTVSAVGLLALVASLKLFGKRSLIFRS